MRTIDFLGLIRAGGRAQGASSWGTCRFAPRRRTTPRRSAAIYNQGIEDRVATLETELRTPEERRAWLAARGARHPVLVASAATRCWPGPASTPSIRAPPTTTWPTCRSTSSARCAGPRRGHGPAARTHRRGAGIGFHKMVLAAFPDNTAGMRALPRMGFTTVGTYREQGCLDGRWVDVLSWSRSLPSGRRHDDWRRETSGWGCGSTRCMPTTSRTIGWRRPAPGRRDRRWWPSCAAQLARPRAAGSRVWRTL